MTANERKKRIMEHLALTSNLNVERRSPGFKPEASPTPITLPTPPITLASRKERIMEHLARSSPNFNCFSLSSEQRKQQIQEHLRLSKG
jgi:hypothetical protein